MPPPGDTLPLAYHRYLISARTDGRVSISKDGGYIGSARDIDDAKRIIDDELPRDNPRFTAKEERQYKHILASGAKRRYGRRAKEVAARTVLKGRAVRRGKRSNPPKKYETTLNGVHVKFFQGYAEDVRYIREADGKPYSHVVETDAAELYLAEHSVYGRCILIVDPSGKTPLWG